MFQIMQLYCLIQITWRGHSLASPIPTLHYSKLYLCAYNVQNRFHSMLLTQNVNCLHVFGMLNFLLFCFKLPHLHINIESLDMHCFRKSCTQNNLIIFSRHSTVSTRRNWLSNLSFQIFDFLMSCCHGNQKKASSP